MNSVSFRNPGVIDMVAVRTFGASSKVGDNPIGFFGTGLKYALAILMRVGCGVTIWAGLQGYAVEKREQKIRNDTFNMIVLRRLKNGAPAGKPIELGFTTELGKTWLLWQAFRELYCNAKDENGECVLGSVAPQADQTTIVVTGEAFVGIYYDRHTIVLDGQQHWLDLGPVHVYERPSQHVYYRGVRVLDLPKPSRYTYNILSQLQLTEDRTLALGVYVVQNKIRDAALFCPNEVFLRSILTTGKDEFEQSLEWDGTYSPVGPLLLDVMQGLIRDPRLNLSAVRLLARKRGEMGIEPREVEISEAERTELATAVALCQRLGYDVTQYPIIVTDELGNHILGKADMMRHRSYISRHTFSQGVRRLAGTILEEYIHLHYKLVDESRALQDHLLDALITAGDRLVENIAAPPVDRGDSSEEEVDDDSPF